MGGCIQRCDHRPGHTARTFSSGVSGPAPSQDIQEPSGRLHTGTLIWLLPPHPCVQDGHISSSWQLPWNLIWLPQRQARRKYGLKWNENGSWRRDPISGKGKSQTKLPHHPAVNSTQGPKDISNAALRCFSPAKNSAACSLPWISPLTTSDFLQQPTGCHDHPLPVCGECRSCCSQHYLDHGGVMTWPLMKAPSLWSAEPTTQLHAPLWLHILPPIWQHVPYRAVSWNLQGNQTQGSLEGLLEKCWATEHRDGTQENSDTDVLSASGTPSRSLCLGPPTASHWLAAEDSVFIPSASFTSNLPLERVGLVEYRIVQFIQGLPVRKQTSGGRSPQHWIRPISKICRWHQSDKE